MKQERLLGRYTLLRELGRDAIGTVYMARDQGTGATLSLQTLDPALLSAADPNLADAFLKNARSAARLRHANIVKVHDAGEAGGTAYVATDLVEGESLRQMLDERPLPIGRAIQIFDDVASALAYAHEQGMLHRGVRPSNIVVLPSGVAKIGDFGIGQIGEAALHYLSPEQVRGEPVDPRSDLFSLGTVLYEMLTRRTPFEGSSAKEIRESILRAQPPRPSEVNPHVPGALDQMVLGLLAGQPSDRPANARLLLRDVHRLKEGLGLRSAAPAVAAPTIAPEPAPRAPEPVHEAPQYVRREPTFDAPDERVLMHRAHPPVQRPRSRSNVLAGIALLLALASIGLTVYLNYAPHPEALLALVTRKPEAPPPAVETPKQVAIAPVAPPAPVAAPAPTPAPAPEPLPAKPVVVEPIKPAQPPRLPPAELEQTAVANVAPPAPPPAKKAPEPQPAAASAKLVLTVLPQGEIYVDGEHAGSTPPLTTLALAPGMHRIEIRNGSRRPFLTYMTVEPGDERQIRHDFNAKPMRPPA